MKKLIVFLTMVFVMLASSSYAVTIKTARGDQEVSEGDVLGRNSMWKDQIKGLKDVTFYEWNFGRKMPETEVFVDCQNLIFIKCNLTNVKIPSDSKVIDCLTLSREEYEENGKSMVKIVNEDDDVIIYEKEETEIDLIERDFSSLGEAAKAKIRATYEKGNIPTVTMSGGKIIKTRRKAYTNEKISIKDSRKFSPNDIVNR